MVPLSKALAILVVHELNVLAQDEGCCADCCAPCGVLRALLDDGQLPTIIARAPAHLAEAWRPFDEAAIRARWGCQSRPRCDTLHDDTIQDTEHEETTP